MNDLFTVQMSNRTELLFEEFKDYLYQNSHPFTRRIVIVPSAAMKSWLMLKMAEEGNLGISAGIEIGYVEPTIKKLAALMIPGPKEESYEPKELEIALAIESEIVQLIESQHKLTLDELHKWRSLLHYLGVSEKGRIKAEISKRVLKRTSALSATLAKVFVNYGLYGGEMLPQFLKEESFQSLLWHKLDKVFEHWNYPYRKLHDVELHSPCPSSDLEVHIFGLSYIAPLYHRFLLNVSKHVPVTYYFLSPCEKFWSDLVSDKERLRIQKFFEKKGVAEGQKLLLDDYLRDTNPLLSNFGRLGREMAKQLDEGAVEFFGRYALVSSATHVPSYQDLISPDVEFIPSQAPLTMLEALQTDIVLLRNPDESEKVKLNALDGTVQIHAVPKPMREVEVVHDLILSIIERHNQDKEPITQGDIVVMASNLATYEPFIKAVFEKLEGGIDIQLMDVQIPSQNTFVQCFLHLINLSFGRFDSQSLMKLFDYKAFQRKFEIKPDEVQQITDWIKESKISWGTDLTHREEVLKRDHCIKGLVGKPVQGTWEIGLRELLDRLIRKKSGDELLHQKTLPQLNEINPSQGELIGKVLGILRSLQADLKILADQTTMTISDWVSYLSCLSEGYLKGLGDENGVDGERLLKEHFNLIKKADAKIKAQKFPFSTIQRALEESLKAQSSSYKESSLNAVRFCSLLPMRAVPAKVIILMGMGDGLFPRQEPFLSFNHLQSDPLADYFPSQSDFDRYLFFEALLSARRYFLMTYTCQAAGESEELLPSLLLKEMMSYIDKAYEGVNGTSSKEALLSLNCFYKHPMKSYDSKYFTPESKIFSYSKENYLAALSFYNAERESSFQFIDSFKLHNEPPERIGMKERVISLPDLAAFAKSPLKTYFTKFLDIYMKDPQDNVLSTNEDLLLSRIDLARFKKAAIHFDKDELMDQLRNTRQFPLGPFKEVVEHNLYSDICSLKDNMSSLGIQEGPLATVDFNEQYETFTIDQGNIKAPPLKINVKDMGPVFITGKIEAISEAGIVFYESHEVKGLVKVWPTWLVYCCLLKRDQLPFGSNALFIKDKEFKIRTISLDDVEELLSLYLTYYFQSLKSPSPLMPELVQSLIKDDLEEAKAYLEDDSKDEYSKTYDLYLKWMRKKLGKKTLDEDLRHWQRFAMELYPR